MDFGNGLTFPPETDPVDLFPDLIPTGMLGKLGFQEVLASP
jgi:hypothetical protein